MAQPKRVQAKNARAATPPATRHTGAAGADAPPAVRGGIAQLVTPSPALGAIVGSAPLSRAELTKRVWAYIKQHTLQDTQDRRQIKADAALKQVLGRDQVSMFELPKLLNQHVTAAQP